MDSLISHKENSPREARKVNDSTFERIYKFYFSKSNYQLSPKEEEIRERWDFSWKLLCNMFTRREAVYAVQQKFKIEEWQAYDDVRNAMQLFGDPKKPNKEAKRALAEEWLVKGIKKAWADQDLDAYERLIGRYSKINGLEVENDTELQDKLSKMIPTALMFVVDADKLKEEAAKLMDNIPTEDINFEEVRE